MNKPSSPLPKTLRTAVATAVLAAAGLTSFSALAAASASTQRPDAAARAEIQQTYRAERAACTDGSSTQERRACLAEAAAARKEALAGSLGMQNVARNETARPGEPDLMANALARCDAVPGDVRLDCERRVIGGDSVIVVGSVADGVIVRELAPAEPAVMVAQADTPPETRTTPRPALTQPVEVVVADPQEPTMDAPPADRPQAAAGAGLIAGETRVPVNTAQATGQTAEPVDLISRTQAAAEAQAQADAQRSADALVAAAAQPVTDSVSTVPETQAMAGPAARGADPVAYPEWMVQQRFE